MAINVKKPVVPKGVGDNLAWTTTNKKTSSMKIPPVFLKPGQACPEPPEDKQEDR